MDDFPEDDDFDDFYSDPASPDERQRFWTHHRIFMLILAIIMLVTLFVYLFSGLFIHPPPPPPTRFPGSLL